jgi:hypothetical protein
VILGRTGGLQLLANKGGFTLEARRVVATPFTPGSLAALDFDGDGDTDIAASGLSAPGVFLYSNQGGFQFALSQEFAATSGNNALTAADFDGDGASDLAFDNGSVSALVRVALNAPGPAFFAAERVMSATTAVHELGAGDLNGDGLPGLVYPGGFLELGIYFTTP